MHGQQNVKISVKSKLPILLSLWSVRAKEIENYRDQGTTIFVISGCADWFVHPLRSEIKFCAA